MALTQRLQLTLDEFVELWCSIVEENFRRCLADDIVGELSLNDEQLVVYSAELCCVQLFLANKAIAVSRSMNEKIAKLLGESIVNGTFLQVLGSTAQNEEQYRALYQAKYALFDEVCKQLADKDKAKREADLASLASYLVSTVAQQEQHVKAISLIGVNLIGAWNMYATLLKKTMPEKQMNGKTTFLVAR